MILIIEVSDWVLEIDGEMVGEFIAQTYYEPAEYPEVQYAITNVLEIGMFLDDLSDADITERVESALVEEMNDNYLEMQVAKFADDKC